MIKSEIKQFQYEVQSYQEQCVANIIGIFERLEQGRALDAVMTTHQAQHGYHFPIQADSKNIDVVMETGTGKTFTFIKTMFEINKHYGNKKFIILIPTVPIREGTKTNLADTKDYFKSVYANDTEKEINVFVYENGNTSIIDNFLRHANLSVLIMTPSAFSHDANILNRPLEREIHTPDLLGKNHAPPKSYLEALKNLHPIVIMDEPHRFDGDAFKTYFKGFDNYCLRFGATFPKKKDSLVLSNVAYVLDSISSFRQNLVKKIVVYTQDIVENNDTLIGIEKDSNKNIALVSSLSNGIVIQRKLKVGNLFNGKAIKKILKNSLTLVDDSIEKVDYILNDDAIRAMIRQTISIHFAKEQDLFERGIKALSLFFIPNDTSLFRGDNPKIKMIFEEEYHQQRQAIFDSLEPSSAYYAYLQNDVDNEQQLQVHKGYFSGDKGSNDDKVQAGVDEILKDKKKLLSFESPTRFIFSIWALQEGWDNPNVFTICKLSNQGSEISKLQQIGRGLRICVNQDLQRQTLKYLGENQQLFWEINNLDVVVSSKEYGFVQAIQQEILNNSYLVAQTFTEVDLTKILQEKTSFDDNTIIMLIDNVLKDQKMIVRKAIVDGQKIYEKSSDFESILKQQKLPQAQRDALAGLFASDIQEHVQNGNTQDKSKKKQNIYIKTSHFKAFQELWQTIHKNAFYSLKNLTPEQHTTLIDNIKCGIEAIHIDEILLQTVRANLHVEKIGNADAVTEQLVDTVSYQSQVDYLALVHRLSSTTRTPLAFVVNIFNALSDEFKHKILCNNPKQAQKEMAKIINQHLVSMLKTNISYEGMTTIALPNVFKTENGKIYLDKGSVGKYQKTIDADFSLKEKWVFEEVIEYDSQFELDIIETDPDIQSIDIFGKLPRLEIQTPLGKYNPDFCYAINSKTGTKVFLIVEAKGYDTSADIPPDEKVKIEFAHQYFAALNQHYQGQNIQIAFKERINRTQLAALIKSI